MTADRLTPETDRVVPDAGSKTVWHEGRRRERSVVDADVARRLERERDEARERLEAAETEIEVIRGALDTKCYELSQALKRLESEEAAVENYVKQTRVLLDALAKLVLTPDQDEALWALACGLLQR